MQDWGPETDRKNQLPTMCACVSALSGYVSLKRVASGCAMQTPPAKVSRPHSDSKQWDVLGLAQAMVSAVSDRRPCVTGAMPVLAAVMHHLGPSPAEAQRMPLRHLLQVDFTAEVPDSLLACEPYHGACQRSHRGGGPMIPSWSPCCRPLDAPAASTIPAAHCSHPHLVPDCLPHKHSPCSCTPPPPLQCSRAHAAWSRRLMRGRRSWRTWRRGAAAPWCVTRVCVCVCVCVCVFGGKGPAECPPPHKHTHSAP